MPQPSRATKATKSESIGKVETDKVDMMSSLERLLDDKLLDLKKDLATKECINELKSLIVEQRNRIDELESKVVVMGNLIEKLQEHCDDNKQYQRRLCLRIDGVELPQDSDGESGDKCLSIVKKIFKELKVNVPDSVIDRAHRIGKVKVNGGKRSRQIIVRFTTWRHRTQVYRARKKSAKYKVCLDLTKEKMNFIATANDMLKSNGKADEGSFVFTDINCRPCLKLIDDFKYFSSEKEMLRFISNLDKVDEENDENEEVTDDFVSLP